MKVLVVDDEKLARKRILKILQNRKGISLFEASSGTEAVSKIKSELPNIVFLDIKMTDFSGFEVLKKIDPSILPITVFVTAFDDFAIEAFEIQAIDYVLKPYKESRVLEALENAVLNAETKQKSDYYDEMHSRFDQLWNHLQEVKKSSKGFLEKIVLKVGRKYLFAYTKDIKYITSSAYYAELFMMDGKKHIHRTSMTALMEKLDPSSFLRLNRSTIVQIAQIKEVISEGYGDYCVIMRDNQKFNVSKSYKTAVVNQLNLRKS
ncbi:LytR/AlgR family response regulator transcription factor [Flagellimonas meridianipacifica]|uniref:Two-component system LytT family response regulator n=1 Tax=Flagellimonas meridianipacifica TaxID=1080225 RepID=A0A2T0M8S2_9FLAO|nr:LytTR family DNA-binding domain-containing protein [Allomuricauda pacifica]PRX53937.1 two-component system LytT family response regulator [Allomuricauda pacifica]